MLSVFLIAAGYNKIYSYFIDFDVVPGRDDPWEHMGLVTKSLDKKPAFDSYKTIIRKVDYFTGIKKLDQGQYVYTFSGRDPVYVLWHDSRASALPSSLKRSVKVTDYLGNEKIKPVSEIVLTESPVFVEAVTKGL